MKAILPEIPLGEKIPRIIFQTYKTRDLPAEISDNVRRIRSMNPGWDYRFFDDDGISKFISEEYDKHILSCFESINPLYGAARADLFRYLLIYRMGGVYLDIKSGVTRPLDEMIHDDDRFILSHWQNDPGSVRAGWGLHQDLGYVPFGEYQQWHVIAAAGHPFLRAVIDNTLSTIREYRPWIQGIRQQGVLNVTGPVAYTKSIFPLLAKYPHREVRSDEEMGLRYSFTPDYLHKRFFGSHYTRVWAPLILRPGWAGLLDRSYARLLEFRNTVAVRTFPVRQKLRSLVFCRWKQRS